MNTKPLTEERKRELYRRYISGLVSDGMLNRVRDGVLPGCAPVGYLNTHINGERAIVVDPKLGPLVQEAFRLAKSKKYSLRKILKELTPKGLVSRNGKPIGPSALMGILKNPFYTGRIRYYGELLPGGHEALVDDKAFMAAVEALRIKRKR